MSKLVLSNRVPRDYNAATFQEIVRLIEEQSNLHAEGKLRARHGAMTSAPTSGNWEKGDIVWNSAPTAGSPVGWICVTSGTPGTFERFGGMPVLGAEIATTSGTSVDITDIPSWVTHITIQFVGVSTSGTSQVIVQIGDSGGPETTGYLGTASDVAVGVASNNYTTGYGIEGNGGAATVRHGQVVLSLEDAAQFTWVSSSVLGRSDVAATSLGGGSKSLSAALDRVRITTVGGADTFDAGVISVLLQ